jgi:hypothetical protein
MKDNERAILDDSSAGSDEPRSFCVLAFVFALAFFGLAANVQHRRCEAVCNSIRVSATRAPAGISNLYREIRNPFHRRPGGEPKSFGCGSQFEQSFQIMNP